MILLLIASGSLSLGTEKMSGTEQDRDDNKYQAYQHFVNGDLLELSGNPQGAVAEYQTALKLNPNLQEARLRLAQILYRLKDIDGSLAQALQLPMQTAEELRLAASLYAAKQDFKKARDYYQKAVDLDSTDINSLYALVQLYSKDNQNDSSLALMQRISRLAPPNSQTHQQVGEYYLRLNQPGQAIAEFQRAIELDSSNYQAYAGIGLAYEAQKDFKNALKVYLLLQTQSASNPLLSQKIIGLYYGLNLPDSAISQAKSAVRVFPDNLSLKKVLGSLYFSQRSYAQSESVFTALLQSNPDDLDAILYLGRIALATKSYAEAETRLRKVLDLNDTLLEAWFTLADTSLEERKYQEAAATYEQSLSRTSDTITVYLAMGLGYSRAKRFPDAEKYLLQALQIRPKDTRILMALGNLYQQQGDSKPAEKYFSLVLEAEPDNATALNNLGYLWAEQGENLKKSLEMIGRALQAEPNNPAFLDSYGWNLFKQGRLREAEEYLKKAQILLPNDPEVYLHLGDLYHSQKKPKLAREYWQKGLKLDPDNQKLREKLESPN